MVNRIITFVSIFGLILFCTSMCIQMPKSSSTSYSSYSLSMPDSSALYARNTTPKNIRFIPEISSPSSEKVKSEKRTLPAFSKEEPVLELFRRKETHNHVIDFFVELTGNERIAATILYYADFYSIPPLLAFSLVWTESRYNPKAVNRNSRSIDRGLFQLNSRSFPDLSEMDFFDIEINAEQGMRHLHYCLGKGENEIVALAIYNAGSTQVSTNGAPASTLHYISKLLEYKDNLRKTFVHYMSRHMLSNSASVLLTSLPH